MFKNKVSIKKGLFENYNQIDELLFSVDNSNDTYFVPSFSLVEVFVQNLVLHLYS